MYKRSISGSMVLSLVAGLVLSFLYAACFADETLTITTYYPSPYGSYSQLAADQIAIGSLYRNPTYADGTLYVSGNVGIGTTSPNSSKGTAGYVDAKDVYLRDVSKWASEGGATPYALLNDQKADGTNSGQFVSGDWRRRDLNTKVNDGDGIVSLSSNQFTLQAGTYRIHARTPAYNVSTHKARLQNVSDGYTVIWGTNAYLSAGSPGQFWSVVVGEFTISSAKTFELQDRCSVTGNEISLGVQDNISGTPEIYSLVEIWKIS